jgi:prepilin-type N-terminal cleavage/methylation domain-containing protein
VLRKHPWRGSRSDCRGMTLLELVLALALSGLLLMAISMALHIHWRAFDGKRSRVEEAQLASAILRNISDDIRGTLKFEPPNLEGLNLGSLASNALGSVASGALSGGETENGGGEGDPMETPNPTPSPMQPATTPMPSNNTQNQGGGGTGGGDSTATGGGTESGASTTGATTEETMPAESGPSVVVGLYGSATQLQFDISRLPRVDQYQSLETDDGSLQVPSDIKTVVYFLASEESTVGAGAFAMTEAVQPSTTGAGRGLMRAESDRAVSAYGELNGSSDSLFAGARLLAAEVTSVQFQYFDGTEWLTEWNSDDLGGLPTAIEVLLTIGAPQSGSESSASPMMAQPLDAVSQPTYRMVVHLPVGGISPATEESTEMTGAAAGETNSTNTTPPEAMP